MRKLLEIRRGDWKALVTHVREDTRLKTGPLAERAGVSPETWWRWENRGQRPKEADMVERFARAFALELDDAMWAAGLLFEDQTEDGDPRLAGLDPNDLVVKRILEAPVDEEMRDMMLDRRRWQLAEQRERDLRELEREIEFWRSRGRGSA